MVDSVQQVQAVVALLRDWGHTVIEVDGWQNRGSGNLTTQGRLEHHTAGARSGDAPSLRVVTFGRAGLRNSLCRFFVSRSGVIYLVARRVSWHAGAGDKGSNSTLSGTEAENTGVGEPWQPRSLEAQAAISAAECIVFGVSPQRVWDHREHATPRGRKIDRTGVPSGPWRNRVAALVAAGGPTGVPTIEEDDVLERGDKGGEVTVLQWRINSLLHGQSDPRGNGHNYGLKVDGDFGPETEAYVREVQSRFGYTKNPGKADASLLVRIERRLLELGRVKVG